MARFVEFKHATTDEMVFINADLVKFVYRANLQPPQIGSRIEFSPEHSVPVMGSPKEVCAKMSKAQKE